MIFILFMRLLKKPLNEFKLVSRIFRAGSKSKNRALLDKGFREPKSGARINKDTNNLMKGQLR